MCTCTLPPFHGLLGKQHEKSIKNFLAQLCCEKVVSKHNALYQITVFLKDVTCKALIVFIRAAWL